MKVGGNGNPLCNQGNGGGGSLYNLLCGEGSPNIVIQKETFTLQQGVLKNKW